MKAGRFCRRAFSFSGCRESSLPARGGMTVRRSATFQIPKYKVIPAHFSRTHTAPRPVHPRALREASFSGTGSRWPRTGATGTPNARRSKPHGPSRQVRHCQTGRRSRPRPPFRFDAATHRHDMALLWSVGCSNMSLSRKQAQTGAMLHRAAPSLGWRAWNAYATIQARSSMKTERPIGATRN